MLADAIHDQGGPTEADDSRQRRVLPISKPVQPIDTIRYQLAARTKVELRVYDVSGAVVRTLVDDVRGAGAYSLEWNGRDDRGNTVSSGVYFYRLNAGDFSDVRKMTLVK